MQIGISLFVGMAGADGVAWCELQKTHSILENISILAGIILSNWVFTPGAFLRMWLRTLEKSR